MNAHVEQLEFQAEARQLLDLMVHSVYSNKDAFLRELISNASDALDKLRIEALRNKDLEVDTSDLHIEIDADKAARTLTVRDNGIGMAREEVVDLIGTLAKSGTAELRAQLREAKNAAASEELIGQFGIGFYSSFMVADKVQLLTRKAGESAATRWESSGEGTYTIESVEDAPQGTSVTLHLKPEDAEDDLHDYTSEWKIRNLVKKYSDFIAWPIRMDVERRTPASQEEGGEGGEETVTIETETLNSMKALWARPKEEVSEQEYKEFYKHVAHAWDDPLEIIAMKAEGTFEYQALLFIPSHAPFDLFDRDAHVGIQLYVKRVFIMGDCDQLMPEYLRFVKGVVDAQDMSLNVSREILQQDRQIKAIRRRLTKKVLSTIKDVQSSRPEDYRTFWTQFGRVLKEGLLSDIDNRETLLGISSFVSTYSEEEPTTLAEYVERMKDGQQQIFYATGETRQQLLKSPHLEASPPGPRRRCREIIGRNRGITLRHSASRRRRRTRGSGEVRRAAGRTSRAYLVASSTTADLLTHHVGEEAAGGNRAKRPGGVGERVAGLRAELDVSGRDVELELLDTGRSGNGDHPRQANQPGQCHLGGLGVDVDGDGAQRSQQRLYPAQVLGAEQRVQRAHATGTILESVLATQ